MSSSIQINKTNRETRQCEQVQQTGATIRKWTSQSQSKKLFSLYKNKRLENMRKEQETNIGQADLKINHVEYLEMESKIIEI